MQLDLPTLITAGSLVAAVAGAFLLTNWWQDRTARPMLWWALATFAMAFGLPLSLRIGSGENFSLHFGYTLLNLATACVWVSSRLSNRRSFSPLIVFAGAALWAALHVFPEFRGSHAAHAAANQFIMAAYLFAAGWEFHRRREELINARTPLVVLVVIHGAMFVFGGIFTLSLLTGGQHAVYEAWLLVLHFETLAFVIGTSMFAVAMMREEAEAQLRLKASTDELTGLRNRREFYRQSEELIEQQKRHGKPLSAILFDLDGFKKINDTYGHGLGDEILRRFSDAASETLGKKGVVGRIGGEEFAAVLPLASADDALEAANRVREAFTGASNGLGIGSLRATCSAGVVEARQATDIDSLLDSADAALYRAKANGRDRTELFDALTARRKDRDDAGSVAA